MNQIKKSSTKTKTIIRIILTILAAAIIGLNIYTLNASFLTGDGIPMPLGVGAAVVVSGSMEPELSVGDLIIIKERDAYEVNDVIVYQDNRASVTHRIIGMDEKTVTTKGDANNTEDSPVRYSQIKGEVVFVIPLVGYLVSFIKTPIGTLFIIALAILLLERSFKSEKQSENKEIDKIREEIEKLKAEQGSQNQS